MKKIFMVLLLFMVLPVLVWAKDPSNAELYKMFKELEVKLDKAISDANKAKAEADKAKKEAAKAKEELERIKKSPTTAVSTESLVRASDTKPGVVTSVEAFYLRPSRGNLDYVIVDEDRTGNVRGDYRSVEPEHGWGGRVGLGYDFGSGADIGLKFTWLDTEDKDTTKRGSDRNLWGTWLHPNAIIDDNDVTRATAEFDLDYYVADLSLGQNLDIGKYFGMRVEGGLRYAEIHQDFDITYLQEIDPTADRKVYVEHKNKFTGWGGRLGLGLDWRVGWGFNIFTSVAGSLMVGDFELDLWEHDYQVAAVSGTRRVDISETFANRIVPVVETRAGIGYAYQFENGWTAGALVGYEWQNWFNMVTAKRGADDVDSQLMDVDTTDLGLDGFFFEAYVHF